MATPTAAPTLTATGTPTATPGGRATPSTRRRPTLAGRLGEQAARSLHKSAELPHKLDVTRVPAIKVIFITGQYLSWLPLPVAFFFAISGFSLPYRDRSKSPVEVVSKKSARVSARRRSGVQFTTFQSRRDQRKSSTSESWSCDGIAPSGHGANL